MRNYAGTCKRICSYNLVYNFLIQLLPLQSSVFVVQFSNAFWHGNEAFKKVVLRMKMLVSHLCCTPIARVSLVLDSCCSCLTYVALMSLVSHSCLSRLSLVLSIRLHRNLVEIYFSLSISLFFSIRTFLVLQNDQSFSWFL